MKETLKICDQAGLIRVTFNSQDDLTFICNCSAKSCLAMEPIIKASRYGILPRSAFVPVLDSTLCKGCGICANERCGLKALEMKDGEPILKAERCIGCALCASGCPENARQMQKSPTVPEAPTTTQDLMQTILQERGKMEGFMELLMHPPQS